MVPVETVTVTSKLQSRLVRVVSQVHQTFQCPPVWYCVKMPTPWPGLAFMVRLGSTSTSIGCVDAPAPEEEHDEPEPPPYPPLKPPLPSSEVCAEQARSKLEAATTPKAKVR